MNHETLMIKRDAIVQEMIKLDATHATTMETWHGYTRPAGTLLIASPELGELFGRSELRDSHGCLSSWYVQTNGEILELWEHNVEEYEAPYCCGDDATLPEGIEIVRARFTGNRIAVCRRCEDYRVAYWECPCELVHECVTDDEAS